ncbi:ABC transporter permease [Thorsellia kenyensis]|uniref:ABC transporter permease n=1 Tax=Thorsellia kenyensis TaxID=1549888 RepID=A0ABV6CBC5_9GAMM
MILFTMSFRNLIRHWRKSLSTLFTITIGLTSLIIFAGYNTSIQYSLETAFVRSFGHLQIQHSDFLVYGKGNPTKYSIKDYEKVINALKSNDELAKMTTVVTGHLSTSGIANYTFNDATRTVWVNGFNVQDKIKMQVWNPNNLRLPKIDAWPADFKENDITIGSGLALVLRMCDLLPKDYPVPCEPEITSSAPSNLEQARLPDDIIDLTSESPINSGKRLIDLLITTQSGMPNIGRLEVIGIEKQSSRELDDIYVGMDLSLLQSLVLYDEAPIATSIIIQLNKTEYMDRARVLINDILKDQFPDQSLTIKDFYSIQPIYLQIVDMFNGIFGFILVIILIVVTFTVSNTINMSVMDRINDIGTTRALGLTKNGVRMLFIMEGTILGIFGSFVAIIFSLCVTFFINKAEMTWFPPGVVNPQLIIINLWTDYEIILLSIFLMIAISIFASILPAQRASKMTIIKALKHL